MRARSATAVLAAAVGLGLVTGRFVLPAHSPAPSAPSTAPSTSLPGAGSALPKAATGPLTEQNLLAAAEFEAVGISQHIYVRDRVGDGTYANAACAGEKTLGETLGGPGAHFRGLVTTTQTDPTDPTLAVGSGGQVAREVAADALSQALAQNYTERLLLEEVPCQDEPAGHWVYGPTRTLDVAPGIAASWMGTYQGALNTAGAAPKDKEPCGGIAVLRSGTHYAFLQVNACLDTAAMTRIVRAAVVRL
ncbi:MULTISPECIES: hypothetical protein [Streptacidiphilus]|uniref:PknH-like extracellular domain-containing protein n=1 Tax=Streptacidiphilus cavernicola TaxID=3342716 RepID=A0ABV6UIG0_9ACTN|nr:hypothetical protein [Streptacidiphilus jeojiense]